MKNKRLILISAYNPNDVSKWSGTIYFLYAALRHNAGDCRIEYVRGLLGLLDFSARALNKLLKLFGVSLDCRFSTAYARAAGAYLTMRLLFAKKGALLAIAASNYLPYLKTNRDIVYVSDGTFRTICNLYPAFQVFPKWLQDQGDKNERLCLSRAQHIIYPSRWASDSAKCHYGVPTERILEIPFGPNLAEEWIDRYYKPGKTISVNQKINLLFVSADWERKNGDKAIEIARYLIEAQVDVRLMIVGDAPKSVMGLAFVEHLGFLRKADPDDLSKLCHAYREAHFLILPTGADASPIVFSEAQAFGVPPITYDVGGTSSSIDHGETGLLLPLNAPSNRFAEEILRYVRSPTLFTELSMSCRRRYRDHANWRNWSSAILELVHKK